MSGYYQMQKNIREMLTIQGHNVKSVYLQPGIGWTADVIENGVRCPMQITVEQVKNFNSSLQKNKK